MDRVGAPYLDGNLRLLRDGGELVLIGDLGGSVGTIDLGRVIDKWVSLRGTVLRPRPMAHKAGLVERVRAEVLPLLAAGALRVVVNLTFPLERVRE